MEKEFNWKMLNWLAENHAFMS